MINPASTLNKMLLITMVYYGSHDRFLLLMTLKVDEKEFSIEEMKIAADDIKKLRPVQEAIMGLGLAWRLSDTFSRAPMFGRR